MKKRICIYPNDVQLLTGKSYRFSRELLSNLRQALGKEKHQFITFREFANYTGIKLDEIKEQIH